MSKYLIRLDDACEKRNIEKWNKIESILDKHNIIPLVGVIPHCEDTMMDEYPYDENFWILVQKWAAKGWVIALHGYNHVYTSASGGINPVNQRSEFAGIPLEIQKEKIINGIQIMNNHNVFPKVFFAPAHTFDENTLSALKECSDIRVISDTIANDIYRRFGFTFVPQQSGQVRHLPFKIVTFCYHPNTMSEKTFLRLERFIAKNRDKFVAFPKEIKTERQANNFDEFLRYCYFWFRR